MRRLLHRLGYRFRLHRKDLAGTPDIVLPGRKTVLFVHGCFWHAHGCKIGQPPRSRMDFWGPKLARTQERDRAAVEALEAAGWTVLTVWQCETRTPAALEARLRAEIPAPPLGSRTFAPGTGG
ncbi:MAG: very short patch repair endonuclease [Brevundimonas sp.]